MSLKCYYYKTGKLELQVFCNWRRPQEEGPTAISYHLSGKLKYEVFYLGDEKWRCEYYYEQF